MIPDSQPATTRAQPRPARQHQRKRRHLYEADDQLIIDDEAATARSSPPNF